jgi:hypothetical protein
VLCLLFSSTPHASLSCLGIHSDGRAELDRRLNDGVQQVAHLDVQLRRRRRDGGQRSRHAVLRDHVGGRGEQFHALELAVDASMEGYGRWTVALFVLRESSCLFLQRLSGTHAPLRPVWDQRHWQLLLPEREPVCVSSVPRLRLVRR